MRMRESRLIKYIVPASFLLWLAISGCATDGLRREAFAEGRLRREVGAWRYDINGDEKSDFALLMDADGRVDRVAYDDDQDGRDDRIYRLADYDQARVPHVVLLLDSIPYRLVEKRFRKGEWPWFSAPAKVVPPFPSVSEVIFSEILGGVPQAGMTSRHYDRSAGHMSNLIVSRWLNGEKIQMDQRLHYATPYREMFWTFLDPEKWLDRELIRVKDTIDRNLDRVTLAYLVSSTGMVCAYGEDGANGVLDRVMPFCLNLLYERQGAVRITLLADHGHTFMPGKRFELESAINAAGFQVAEAIRSDRDVVLDADGLMNYVGLHTRHPAELAAALLAHSEVQLATYLDRESVQLMSRGHASCVDFRAGRYRYRPVSGDPIRYQSVTQALRQSGEMDADGFANSAAWLRATEAHDFPDAPVRLWNAFHGQVVSTPDLMITLEQPYYTGPALVDWVYDMASVHGGLDATNSLTFIMSTSGPLRGPLRSAELLNAIEPGYVPPRDYKPLR